MSHTGSMTGGMAAARLATMFQEVFRSRSIEEAEERFEELLDSYQRMP